MNRTPEPELMDTEEQAKAYAAADWESAHSLYPKLFAEKFPRRALKALVLDIGCGPCDVTMRFARANPGYTFHAVDGSAAMLAQGQRELQKQKLRKRIRLFEGFIPGAKLPSSKYDVIISSSLLHHLHDPSGLWQTVKQRSKRGTLVFVCDLRRPASRARARSLVKKYGAGAPEVLAKDFYNSFLAAFTPAEVRRQLKQAGLTMLKVEAITDRHMLIYGKLN